jgi:hypothetical protein
VVHHKCHDTGTSIYRRIRHHRKPSDHFVFRCNQMPRRWCFPASSTYGNSSRGGMGDLLRLDPQRGHQPRVRPGLGSRPASFPVEAILLAGIATEFPAYWRIPSLSDPCRVLTLRIDYGQQSLPCSTRSPILRFRISCFPAFIKASSLFTEVERQSLPR